RPDAHVDWLIQLSRQVADEHSDLDNRHSPELDIVHTDSFEQHSSDALSKRQEHQERREHQGDATCYPKLPCPPRRDSLVDAETCLWCNEGNQRFHHLTPANQCQDHYRTGPDVVEGNDDFT